MKWFRNCKTAEEGKELYRKLAKQYHPDNGGSGEELKDIISEFKMWYSIHKDIHTNEKGETYKAEKETTETAEDFIEIITNLSSLSGIDVELCGTWLWISGNTYQYKTQLASFGCKWSSSKKKWYWTKTPFVKHRCKTTKMEDIRFRYGSQKVSLNPRPCLT